MPLSQVVKQLREELPFECTYFDLALIALSERDPKSLKILEEKQCMMPTQYSQRKSFLMMFHPSQARVLQFNRDPGKRKKKKSISTTRFNAVKQLLSANSYRGPQGKFFIYPGLLLAALEEVHSLQ